ncbi:MAG: FG-GAP-like repeat-containing protein, partial [Flavobacteriales bacterium]
MNKKLLLFSLSVFTILGFQKNAKSQEGAALDFDGNNDRVELGTSINTVLDPINTFTVEAWVKPTSNTGLGCIIGNYSTTSNNNQMQFLLRKDNNRYTFWADAGSGYVGVFSAPGTVTPGVWQHVAGTWDGTTIKIFIDGVELSTASLPGFSFRTTPNPIHIGDNFLSEDFQGTIDEVRIWTVTRTATDILNNMHCQMPANTTGLLAQFHFNDGIANANNTSTTLNNVLGNSYAGTLVNFNLSGTTSNYTTDYKSDYISLQSSIGSTSSVDRLALATTGDFNNDGYIDLLVTAENTEVRFYPNDGKGNFSAFTVLVPPGGYISPTGAGDIDNDGDDDFIHYSGNIIKVFVNDGMGNFSPIAITLNGTGNVSVVKIADVDDDNRIDIIAGNSGMGATDYTEVWLNIGTTGAPAFILSASLDNTSGPRNSIDVGDIDMDGDMDIVTGGSSWGARLFLNNSNDGTFTMVTAPANYSGGARLIDWNQDGFVDYMTNDSYNNYGITVRFNDGNGNFSSTVNQLIPMGFGDVEFVDINSDGFLDLVTSYWGGSGRVYLNNGCELTLQTNCAYNLGSADNCVAVADFNVDGTPDFFFGARDLKSSFYMNYLAPVTTPALSNIAGATGNEICEGSAATITVTTSNPGTISWFTSATGGSSFNTGSSFTTGTLASSTSYFVQSTNANNCTSIREEVEVIVNMNPIIVLGSTSVTALQCNGDTDGEAQVDVTLSSKASTATYLWNDVNATTIEDLTGVGAGTYILEVTDNNNCFSTFSVDITEPTALTASATSTDVILGNDGTVTLSVSGGSTGYNFAWTGPSSFSATSQNLSGLNNAGTYTVTITDANGCTTTATV